IQTTSRVEGYNNIIKQALHSKSSLFDVFKALDSRLEKEAEWNRFFEYQTLSSCLGIASVGSEIFPAIDREMSEFLTPHILSVERTEIAQCLYYNAVLVDLAIVYSYSDYKDEIPQSLTMPCSVTTSNRSAAIRRSKYGELWGLARQAAQIAVECNNNEMVQWLNTFIEQKKQFLASNNKDEIMINEFDNNAKDDDLEIINPSVTKRKGRSKTKRYKSAIEKAHRHPYSCRTC
ncbi:10028_t:CDS:2, partial [Gigaspora margarita]